MFKIKRAGGRAEEVQVRVPNPMLLPQRVTAGLRCSTETGLCCVRARKPWGRRRLPRPGPPGAVRVLGSWLGLRTASSAFCVSAAPTRACGPSATAAEVLPGLAQTCTPAPRGPFFWGAQL